MDPNSPKDKNDAGHVDTMELIVHHTALPETAPSRIMDRFIDRIGSAVSWLWVAVMVVILVSVISRYVFGQGLHHARGDSVAPLRSGVADRA